jgi:hypothetical protein
MSDVKEPRDISHCKAVFDPPLTAAPLRLAVPIFMATSLLFFFSLYLGVPYLRRAGASWFTIFNLVLAVPMFILVLATFIAYRSEGRPLVWEAMRDRLRLQRMDLAAWIWAAALSIFMYGGKFSVALAFGLAFVALTSEKHRGGKSILRTITGVGVFLAVSWSLWQAKPWLAHLPLHSEPAALRDFLAQFATDTFMGIPLRGNWWVAPYYAVVLVLGNVAGEELWWRGYLLPRQELAHGAATWLIHGILWAAFHLFFQTTLWDMVHMIPTCCALAFVAQHTRNTWPGVFGHTFGNSFLLLQIIRGITD